MLRTAPHRGQFRLFVTPSGEIVAPDLAVPLLPIIQAVAEDDALPSIERIACAAKNPKLARTKLAATHHSVATLRSLPTFELWSIHGTALRQSSCNDSFRGASLLDIKVELGLRILQRCTLCEHRCHVDRTVGQTGFCQLTEGVGVAGYTLLYNEGPLVGQPTFGMFLKGCSLRCRFCYRPEDLQARNHPQLPPEHIASILDQAADAGAESWHFLGGNPDESLVGVLQALRATTFNLPVVWNSALYLSREGIELLKGVVDVWLPDFKFGNNDCARRESGVSNYFWIIQRNLLALAREDLVVIRHMSQPGHESCCQAVVVNWIAEHMPQATFHGLECFMTAKPQRPCYDGTNGSSEEPY